jgi:hypothetical protein
MLGQVMTGAAWTGLGFAVLGMLLTSVGDACAARNARVDIHPLRANAVGFCVATVLLAALCAFQGQRWQLDTSAQ